MTTTVSCLDGQLNPWTSDAARHRISSISTPMSTAFQVASAVKAEHPSVAARLQADGVGPLAPVASNQVEEGRAKNRRVELVEQ